METRITSLLDANRIKYRLLLHKKLVFTCEEAAKERNVPLDEMIKCILLVDKQRKYFLVCMTSEKRVDTQKVRDLVGCSRLSFASEQEVEDVLGWKIGSVPPLLLKTQIPVLFDRGITGKSQINISSGNPEAGLELNSRDLISLVNPKMGDITSN